MKTIHALTKNEELQPLLHAIEQSSEIAIDTEADSLFAYRARVCLIQIGTPGKDWVIDPLADIDIQILLDALRDKALLLHGCDYDLRMLSLEYGFRAKAVWDTMIASRYLSETHIGLGALVEKHFGVQLDKSNQKANWAMRPIPERMLAYAAEDTHYLAEIARRQREELAKVGKLTWVEEHCQMVLEHSTLAQTESIPDPDAWRVKGSSGLGRREMALLRSIWEWREEIADRRNVPTFKVMTNDKIIDLAIKFAPYNSVHAGQLSGLPRNIHGNLFDDLLTKINFATKLPLEACPHPIPKPVPPPAPSVQVMEKLKVIRDQLAQEWNVDPSLIANRHQMTHLGLHLGNDPAQALETSEMLNWQKKLWLTKL